MMDTTRCSSTAPAIPGNPAVARLAEAVDILRQALAVINIRSSAGSRTFDECIEDMMHVNDTARAALRTAAEILETSVDTK